MTPKEKIKKALRHDWYVQGFNSVPVFLEVAAWSGVVMDQELGYAYRHFMYHFKEGYGEMWYDTEDFDRLWQIIKSKIDQDPHYLEKTKQLYEKIFTKHERLFKKLETKKLSDTTNKKLFKLVQHLREAMTDAVGIAHIVDAVGQEIEKELKHNLKTELGQDGVKEYFAALTTPSAPSFVAREDRELQKIRGWSGTRRQRALKQHLQQYRWIQNSYRGPNRVTVDTLEERLQAAPVKTEIKRAHSAKEKEKLMKTLSLSAQTRHFLRNIDFITIWQDERKEKVLKTVEYLSSILAEVSKRVGIDVNDLYYLGTKDITNLISLEDLQGLALELAERRRGCYFLHDGPQQYVISGADYQNIVALQQTTTQAEAGKEIHGSVANPGTVTGKVAMCLNFSSLHKVQKGDILVTSMTRPEYMPALKKAAAIVTDEGGITSHAAIVSRELGIPAIIGTKIATKVLKDGMDVEVRANHGFVKIL